MIQRAKKHIVNAMSVRKQQPDSTTVTQLSSLKIVASIFILIIVAAFGGYWTGQSMTGASLDSFGSYWMGQSSTVVKGEVSPSVILNKSVLFIQSLVASGVSVVGNNITESNGVYKISLTLTQGNQSMAYESYVTKDGQLLFESGIPLVPVNKTTTAPASSADITKSDKPVVEAFVMSHCPYGTQIEKGLIPVITALGTKADISIKFVYYAMHGKTEVDEQLMQYCINKEQPAKYLTYLSCFLEAGNSTGCLARAGVTSASLSTCISQTDVKFNITGMFNDKATWLSGTYPQFNIFKDDNVKYGISGSPALVINGVQVSTARDPASLLKLICSAFNTQPAECALNLSSESPSAGFGYSAGTATTASCG